MGEMKKRDIALIDIAMVKAWNFSMEYDTCSGREKERDGYPYLKEGFIEGFLEGFAYKFEQTDTGVE